MIDRDTAIKIAKRAIDAQGITGWEFVQNGIRETSLGWIFIYNSSLYVKTGWWWTALFVSPLVVDRCDGRVYGINAGFSTIQSKINRLSKQRLNDCLARHRHQMSSYLLGGQGHTFLLLHDVPGSALSLTELGMRLGKYFQVIIPDFLGYGESERFPKEDFADYLLFQVGEIRDILQQYSISSLYICGHGLGAAIGLILSNLLPELQIKGYVLSGLNLSNPVAGLPDFEEVLKSKSLAWRVKRILFRISSSLESFKMGAQKCNPLFWINFERSLSEKAIHTTTQLMACLAQQPDVFLSLAQDHIQNIKVDTLLLWGALDNIAPLPLASALNTTISTSTLIVYPYTDHFLFDARPSQIVEDIFKFFGVDYQEKPLPATEYDLDEQASRDIFPNDP